MELPGTLPCESAANITPCTPPLSVTVPLGAQKSDSSGAYARGHFSKFLTILYNSLFQTRFRHYRNYSFRKRALEVGSENPPQPFRELPPEAPPHAAAKGTMRTPSSTVSRGAHSSDLSGALKR